MQPVPRSVTARARRAVLTIVCALSMGLAATMATPAPVEAQAPTPPGPITSGPGSPGPCGTTTRAEDNLAWQDWPAGTGYPATEVYPGQQVWIISPTGTGTPRTGGTCNGGNRPVVVLLHGWSSGVDEWCTTGTPGNPSDPGTVQSNPNFYLTLIQNLVSNGHIVVYPNYCTGLGPSLSYFLTGQYSYDQAWAGVTQAISPVSPPAGHPSTRMNPDDIGVWGHSYGGGMSLWMAEQIDARGWGDTAFWLATYAPYDPLRLDGDGQSQVNLPSPQPRSLHVIYQHDNICDWLWFFGCNVPAWSGEIYNRLNIPSTQKWGLRVNSDCSHPPAAGCNPPADERLLADHFVPGIKDLNDGVRAENHLKYYGSYRNVGALSDCARPGDAPPVGSNDCTVTLTTMGVWSDGVAATAATPCIPGNCP